MQCSNQCHDGLQVRFFDEGKRDLWTQVWQQFVPASALNYDPTTLKLEFSIQVYFSIFPSLPCSSGGESPE